MKVLGIWMVSMWLFACESKAQEISVVPYLQDATPTSIWVMWETSNLADARVHWGETSALGTTTEGVSVGTEGLAHVHMTQLTDLTPDTRYHYQVETGTASSGVYDFVTPPPSSDEAGFSLVAMSDMQIDWMNPDKFEEIVQDGIIHVMEEERTGDLASDLGMVLIPGDLVEDGTDYLQWNEDFFRPAADLISHVPVYPVYGNHERDTTHFQAYFQLPDNGTPGYEDHWWYTDYSNVRVVGLDSNDGYRTDTQLDWLSTVLDETCLEEDIDFVFAELHHPHLSELWLPGETDFTGDVIALLEDFTSACGKPSIHFFGHTHGYSRGQSRDHRHLWVNVASAGGNIDYWGEYAQNDYDEFTVTQDEWGFVLVDVVAGEDPQFTLVRRSQGDEFTPLDNEIRDEIVVRRYAEPPDVPMGLHPTGAGRDPDCVELKTADFAGEEGAEHGATHWQVSTDCEAFSELVVNRWIQHENWYADADLQAGDVLTDEEVTGLAADTDYCWRARFRDKGLSWSAWMEPVSFRTADSGHSPNRVLNGGAEDGTSNWVAVSGPIESLSDGECGGRDPYSGTQYFAVGGLCADEGDYGEAHQDVDVSDLTTEIDAGDHAALLRMFVSDWSGSDEPTARLDMLDGAGTVLASSETIGATSSSWTEVSTTTSVPSTTRTVRVVLMGVRMAGSDNDAYFDDITLRLMPDSELSDCDRYTDGEEPSDTGDPGGSSDTGGPDDPGEEADSGSPDTPGEGPGQEDPDEEGDGSVDTGADAADGAAKADGTGCGCAASSRLRSPGIGEMAVGTLLFICIVSASRREDLSG